MKPHGNQLYLLAGLLLTGLLATQWPVWVLLWKLLAATSLVLLLFDLYQVFQQSVPQVKRVLHNNIPVGVWSRVELQLQNPTSRGLWLIAHDHHPADFQVRGLPSKLFLPAARKRIMSYRVRPARRGDALFAGIDLVCISPLGLWRLKRFVSLVDRVRVFPNFRELGRYALLATDNQLSQMGIRRRQRRGEGSDFHQLREYRVGDSLRQIDWKASARYRRLISKEYQDERDQQLVFLLDCGRHMRHRDAGGAHLDHALNAMLLLSYVAHRQGDAVGFLAFGGEQRWQPPQKGGDLIRRLLERTYDLTSSLEAADYLQAAQQLMTWQRRRALLILLTNSHTEDHTELNRAIRLLSRRHLVVLAQLREMSLDRVLKEPVRDLSSALRYQAVTDYLAVRNQGFDALKHQGALVLDILPEQLPVALVNRYLEIKSSGRL
ncbi:MAG: DUF58 domain-containing protein [Chromatiales bacterium]|jgi:uncharacterized protein (DUF58 family)